MNWKGFVADYLNFTKKDRIAVLVLSCIMILVLLAPNLVSSFDNKTNEPILDTSWITEIRNLRPQQDFADSNQRGESLASPKTESNYHYEYSKGELFYFDPNKLDQIQWQKLGLRKKTINTILNYLSKGGHFYKPDDLSRIYGLTEREFARLEPYIRIEDLSDKPNSIASRPTFLPNPIHHKKSLNIDVNAADSLAWIALPGIGSKLAARIISFRDKLGGFYSIDQLRETYGLQDSVFQKIRAYLQLDNPMVKKISVNSATLEELKAHPYIRYTLANPLIAYRNEHGPFEKLEDLKKIAAITEELFLKISPYLTID